MRSRDKPSFDRSRRRPRRTRRGVGPGVGRLHAVEGALGLRRRILRLREQHGHVGSERVAVGAHPGSEARRLHARQHALGGVLRLVRVVVSRPCGRHGTESDDQCDCDHEYQHRDGDLAHGRCDTPTSRPSTAPFRARGTGVLGGHADEARERQEREAVRGPEEEGHVEGSAQPRSPTHPTRRSTAARSRGRAATRNRVARPHSTRPQAERAARPRRRRARRSDDLRLHPVERRARARDLVRNAARAEEVGFDFASISDHYHPWVSAQGHSPFVWSVLGGIAASTERMRGRRRRDVPDRAHPPGRDRAGGGHHVAVVRGAVLPRARHR